MTIRRETLFGAGQSEPSKAPRPLRVIVADDDRDAVLTLMIVLRHEGHEVRGVYKGMDVLKQMRGFQPDAVLLDINMPELNGYDVARAIVERQGNNRPLLIGVSGVYKMGSDKFLARSVGFDHYLTKPYEASDVLKLLAPLRLSNTGR